MPMDPFRKLQGVMKGRTRKKSECGCMYIHEMIETAKAMVGFYVSPKDTK